MQLARIISGFTLGAACAVFAVLLAITVGTGIVVGSARHPFNKFNAMVVSTLVAGMAASALIELMGVHLLDN